MTVLENESAFLEYKRGEVHPDSLAKELTAFANTQGGTVILGISDDKKIQSYACGSFIFW